MSRSVAKLFAIHSVFRLGRREYQRATAGKLMSGSPLSGRR